MFAHVHILMRIHVYMYVLVCVNIFFPAKTQISRHMPKAAPDSKFSMPKINTNYTYGLHTNAHECTNQNTHGIHTDTHGCTRKAENTHGIHTDAHGKDTHGREKYTRARYTRIHTGK